ncbi:hypothetical protein C7S14_8306 [Burkholderia cepacia]|nr:hypothetical protein C7S14_8306 [Burkholderia cepacia]
MQQVARVGRTGRWGMRARIGVVSIHRGSGLEAGRQTLPDRRRTNRRRLRESDWHPAKHKGTRFA